MKIWINKCENFPPTDKWDDSYIFSIIRDSYSTVFTNIHKLWYWMDQMELKPEYEDLFIIGLSIFAIDKRVSRRLFTDCWTRELEVSIPVICYEKWENSSEKWEEILGFLTGDIWNISFRKTDCVYSRHNHNNRKHIKVKKCDCVSLFSGGLDSYCGAIHLLEEGKSPCLVGHNEYPKLRKKQEQFAESFRECYPDQSVLFCGFTANSRAPKNIEGVSLSKSENTSRGRSLLFLCAAISIAGIIGEETPVYIPENGFIGLNIPLTESRKGTCSTRTTHPYFLREFGILIKSIGINNSIQNFYAFTSKRDVVNDVITTKAFRKHYAETISCSHPCQARWNRNGDREYPINCGYCYPCLIRKSSLIGIEKGNEKYTYFEKLGDFLLEYEESDKTLDLRALINSVYVATHSSDLDVKRKIRIAGKLKSDEVEEFLLVYRKSMSDINELFSSDEYLRRILEE